MTAELRMDSTEVEHLSIAALGREHAGAEDYWSGNWVTATISIAVGGFTGQARASLRTDEIHRFNEALKFLNQSLFGAAVLETIEDWISLTVKVGSRGQIEASDQLRDLAGNRNVLSFELAEVDQTYLPGWISSLDDIETAYPVVSRP